jgi:chaperonin GroEL
MPKPAILLAPHATHSLTTGFNTMAQALAITMGPTQGIVLSQAQKEDKLEQLTDAATIARRILQLPNRAEDVGAMLLRNLVWRMHGRAGDGCATTAVLAQAILEQGHRYRVAGANVMLLQQGIKQAAKAAIQALKEMARPVEDEDDLSYVAETVTGEPQLSLILGEMFDILGPDGYITIQDHVAPYLEREYHEGGRFTGRLISPYLITEPAARRGVLKNSLVALYAGSVSGIDDIQPLLELVAAEKEKKVTLIAYDIKGAALNTLVANHQQKRIAIIAAEPRRAGNKRRSDLEDLAVLTGATVLTPDMGQQLKHITRTDLGVAGHAAADSDNIVIMGTQSLKDIAIRRQIETLQARLASTAQTDKDKAEELRFRIARLSGNVATLKLGTYTKAAREVLKQKANKGLRALPLTLREGVLPGGGVAYLNCIDAARNVSDKAEGEIAWGAKIMVQALEAPFRQIVHNAKWDDPGVILSRSRLMGKNIGYNALTRELVNMNTAGIVDGAGVLRMALETAVSGAAIALTTEVMVLKRNPQQSMEP